MGKLYIGSAEPSKFYVGTEEVKKLYLGSDEIWSASNLPDWLPNGIEALLNNITPPSNYYADLAYAYSAPSSGITYSYFRCFASNINVELRRDSGNFYELFQRPYSSSYRGWTTYGLYYRASGGTIGWYLASTVRNQDRAQTDSRNGSYTHKAIIAPTFTSFINNTGESNWETYN